MRSYRRVLALVDLGRDGEAVARRALQMSRLYGAAFGVAFVVDYTPGFESDHIPFRTPEEMRAAIASDVSAKLDALVVRIGGHGAEVIVLSGSVAAAVADLARSWRPDLVLVASHATHGLDDAKQPLPFDVLTVQLERRTLAGRMVRALAASL